MAGALSSLCAWLKAWPVVHMFLGAIFFLSGVVINVLQLASCLIWPFSRTLYRKISSRLAYLYWSQLVFYAERWSGTECILYGHKDDLRAMNKTNAIVLMNHSYDIDWLMGWVLCERFGLLGDSKVYLKKVLRYIPILGWSWYFAELVFLDRNWEKDKREIVKQLATLTQYPYPMWMVLYCEGTRFTESKHEESIKFALKTGLKPLKNLLLPRTRGFVLTVKELRHAAPIIIDTTLAFHMDGDSAAPTLDNIMSGRACQAHVLIRKIPTSSLPETDEGIADWLIKLYQEKDEELGKFKKTGKFDGDVITVPKRMHSVAVMAMWMFLIGLPLLYYIPVCFIQAGYLLRTFYILLFLIFYKFIRSALNVSVSHKSSSYGASKTTNGTATADNNISTHQKSL